MTDNFKLKMWGIEPVKAGFSQIVNLAVMCPVDDKIVTDFLIEGQAMAIYGTLSMRAVFGLPDFLLDPAFKALQRFTQTDGTHVGWLRLQGIVCRYRTAVELRRLFVPGVYSKLVYNCV